MLVSSSFGTALFLAGLSILLSVFLAGFIPSFLISLTVICFRIKRKKKNINFIPVFLSAILFGVVGGIFAILLGFKMDNYYARKAYRSHEEFSQHMQQQYQILSVVFDENRSEITFRIKVPKADQYNVRIFSRDSRDKIRNLTLPISKDFWAANLEEGENELKVTVPGEYLTEEYLNFVVSIYPSPKREATYYTRREMNNLFRTQNISLVEGIDYYSPNIPFSNACNGIPDLPCVEESKLSVDIQ